MAPEPAAHDIVFRGTFEEVNAHFYEREWSDGLPIVPPTIEKIEEFLSFTHRDPDESLGILKPESRAATIWAVAVNGVMAGCRPEYMPILVALAEAMADPIYGVEHSGNTPGAETLIVLNGPIIKDLNFNYTQGVLRDGFMPNTSVGRFWRLALRNMAGFLLHKTDKGTFGNTFRVVLAENEDCARQDRLATEQRRYGVCGRRQHGHYFALHRRQRHCFRYRQHAAGNDALHCRRRRQANRLGDRIHGGRPDSSAPCVRRSCSARSLRRPLRGRLDQGRRQALLVRSRAHARMAR
jgi:hypothetical protein